MHLGWSLYEGWVHQSLAVGFSAGADSNPFNTISTGRPGFACGAQMAVYTRMRRQDGESHGEVVLCLALEFYL